MKKNIWHRIGGFLAAGLALIACPCHLVLTLPLLISVTAGTAVGALLEQNFYIVIAVTIIVFIGALVLAIRWLGSSGSEDDASSSGQSRALINHQPDAGLLQQDK